MRRRGFTLVEMLLILGILGIVASFSMPMLRSYQLRNDLARAKDQVIQGLERTKLLARSGKNDTVWSFYIPQGIIFSGSGFAARNTALDEIYPMPTTVQISGLTQVTYDKKGLPNVTGEVFLVALSGEGEIVSITIFINNLSITTSVGANLTVCHHNSDGTTQSLVITDAQWPPHAAHGDSIGPCPGTSPGALSSAGFSSSLANAPVTLCPSLFTITQDGVITAVEDLKVTFKNLASKITFGEGGPVVPVHVCYSRDAGANYNGVYGGGGGSDCKGSGNSYGNAVQPSGVDETDKNLDDSEGLAVKVRGQYKQHGSLEFFAAYATNDRTGHVIILRNGDDPVASPDFGNTQPLQGYLQSKSMLDANGRLIIGQCELLLVTELEGLRSPDADFDDDVLLLKFVPD